VAVPLPDVGLVADPALEAERDVEILLAARRRALARVPRGRRELVDVGREPQAPASYSSARSIAFGAKAPIQIGGRGRW
jgi:hypothetical protein